LSFSGSTRHKAFEQAEIQQALADYREGKLA
jgi:hypothetical protein